MARIKISLVVCLFQVLGVYGLPRMVAAESEEQAIIRENREAMKATWRGRVTLEENSCYYRTQPENRISFKTKGRQIGKAFKLSGFQNTPFTMQRNEDFEYPEISFFRWKRDRYGRLTNCYRYEWLSFDSFNNVNEADVSFQREYHCGGLHFCSTVFKGTARRQGKVDIEGFYKGTMSADGFDNCINEDIPSFWIAISNAPDGSLLYEDAFLPTNSSVVLNYDSEFGEILARYSFTGLNLANETCKIDAVYVGNLKSPGRYSSELTHKYTCPASSFTCSWSGGDIVRR